MLRISRVGLACTAAAAAVVSLSVTGCASGGGDGAAGGNAAGSAAPVSIRSLVGDWSLRQIEGQDVVGLVPDGWTKAPSLSIAEDGKVSGSGGVNRLMSSLDVPALARGEFSLKPVASTMMAGPPEAMRLESLYTTALGRVTGFNLDGGTLNLTSGRETLLKFVRGL